MKLTNICGYRNIEEYVTHKLADYQREKRDFETLFAYMFRETNNVMAETSDGYRIKKTTYGECQAQILALAPHLDLALSSVPKGALVGLYMGNSLEWIEIFWTLLLCGYKPLLMNTRLSDKILTDILADYAVKAVVSDGKIFEPKTVLAGDITESARTKALPLLKNPVWADEIVFMSSGTTENVKLCVYNAENLFYQICDSVNVVKSCPQIAAHYQGELKHLVLLPFYHVFGFIAVYVWFAFFSRTFVFPKNLQPQTVLNTVKKHKATHIFAVPLVWDSVYKAATRKIRLRGEKTYKKFEKGLKFVNGRGRFGTKFARRAFKEVRDNLFGDSIQFLISGGSMIHSETLAFFNGIGYHLANGYGMTEIGITSVETTSNKKMLISASIGHPFEHTRYRVAENGELEVQGKARASAILQGGVRTETDFTAWFKTKDLVSKVGERYYIGGRKDDLIVCKNGENLNPVQAEKALKVEGADGLCLFQDGDEAILLVSAKGCYSPEKLQALYESLLTALKEANLENEVRRVLLTTDPLIEGTDFKISRKKVARRFCEGAFRLIDPHNAEAHLEKLLSELEIGVQGCIGEILDKAPEEIGVGANFFQDLGGSSLDYFTLTGSIKSKYGVDLSTVEGQSLSTVREICDFISKR